MEITRDPNHRCWSHWGIPDGFYTPSNLTPIPEEDPKAEKEDDGKPDKKEQV